MITKHCRNVFFDEFVCLSEKRGCFCVYVGIIACVSAVCPWEGETRLAFCQCACFVHWWNLQIWSGTKAYTYSLIWHFGGRDQEAFLIKLLFLCKRDGQVKQVLIRCSKCFSVLFLKKKKMLSVLFFLYVNSIFIVLWWKMKHSEPTILIIE